jgi:hypothetical protein
MSSIIKIGDKYKPTKLLKDQTETEYFTVLEVFPKIEMVLIKYSDDSVRRVQFWFINNYCKLYEG